jgi:lipopolysaccharide export system protein LptA
MQVDPTKTKSRSTGLRAKLLPTAIALLLTSSAIVQAGQSDFEKPITVDSKNQFLDGKNKTSIFKDDVRITQGSMEIRADEVEVIATDGEGKEVFIARGNPAIYAQDMDDGSRVSAQANVITYEVVSRAITLDGDAQLIRDTSMVQGDLIQFDMEKEQLLAQSGDDEETRVKTVFRPETFRDLQNEDPSTEEKQQDEDPTAQSSESEEDPR